MRDENKGEVIAYAIRKKCQENSLEDWCRSWGITVDEFYNFLELGRQAFDEKERVQK